MMTVGKTIRIERVRLDMTQTDLAGILRTSKGYISEIERGKRRLPGSFLEMMPEAMRREVARALVEERERAIDPLRHLAE